MSSNNQQVAKLSRSLDSIPPRHLMLSAFKKILAEAPTEGGMNPSVHAVAEEEREQRRGRCQEGEFDDPARGSTTTSSGARETATEEELIQAMARLPSFIKDTAIPAVQQELPDVDSLINEVNDNLVCMGFYSTSSHKLD